MSAPLVVSDLDGTLTAAEIWRGVLAWVRANRPSLAARRFVMVRLPLVVLAKLGLSDAEAFRAGWLRDEARLLRGMAPADLAAMGDWVVEHFLWPARRVAVLDAVDAAMQLARAADPEALLLVASGGYQPVVEAFARRLGAIALGTPLELRDGVATGGLAGAVRSGRLKAEAVLREAGEGQILVAFGDTAADVPVLSLAARPVAVAPDAVLRRTALGRGWQIIEA